MARVGVFVDANILFSAALGGASFELLWDIARSGKIALLTSLYCVEEARLNLEQKRPDLLPVLLPLLEEVQVVGEPQSARLVEARSVLPDKDAPVLAAALEGKAAVLVTGDLKHFGALMKRNDLSIRVRTLRRFLLEGPPPRGR